MKISKLLFVLGIAAIFPISVRAADVSAPQIDGAALGAQFDSMVADNVAAEMAATDAANKPSGDEKQLKDLDSALQAAGDYGEDSQDMIKAKQTELDNTGKVESFHQGEKTDDTPKTPQTPETPQTDKNKPDEQPADTDLQQAADEAQAKQTSKANMAITGASIGAMGMGGSELAQGLAEKNADEQSAQEMESYRATFSCGITGMGHPLRIDETGTTPEYTTAYMTDLQNYKDTAARLCATEKQLDMPTGTECDELKNTDSLYTNEQMATISRDGAFGDTAAARLASGDADKKIKTGAIVAGAGALVGIAGSILVNNIKPEWGAGKVPPKTQAVIDTSNKLKTEIDKTPTTAGATGESLDKNNTNETATPPEANDAPADVKTKQQQVAQAQTEVVKTTPANIVKSWCDNTPNCANNKLTISGGNFDTDKYDSFTTASTAATDLATAAASIVAAQNQYPNYTFHINVNGYTDSTGSETYNNKLSQNRADFVKSILINNQIPSDAISSSGLGETNPIALNTTKDGRAQNRRVEVILTAEENPQSTPTTTSTDSSSSRGEFLDSLKNIKSSDLTNALSSVMGNKS